MPSYIIKLGDKYFEWSTIVDAPVTYAMSQDELRRYVKTRYGEVGLEDLPARLERVESTGTSSRFETLAELIAANRAGENESHLSEAEILTRYDCQ